ncbi:MAG: hypothetical protein H6835_10700 [Planctomycetes bacterium]|nr:hypothetical protein [Planctomycetota bacterium]
MLAAFAAQLARRGLGEHQIAELLDHLHCSIEQRIDAGDSPVVATRAAIAAVGDVADVTREYQKEGLMHPLQKLLGIAFVFLVFVVALNLQGAHMTVLVSEVAVIPLLMITGVTLGGLVASFGVQRTARMFSVSVLGRRASLDEAPLLLQVCLRGQRLAWTGCVLMVTTSAMHICSVLDNPAMIGPAIAWTLIGVVYAALIADLGFGSAERWITLQAA